MLHAARTVGSTLTRRVLFSGLILFVLALVATSVVLLHADQRASRRALSELAARLEAERLRRETLEREIADSGRRFTAYRDDVQNLVDTRRDRFAAIARTVQTLEAERLKQIQPYVTWGHLADARPHQLAHDAGTATGGSGGPIFATSGRVIGLSTAVVRSLDGAALGTPIPFALALLKPEGRAESPIRGESRRLTRALPRAPEPTR